MCHTHTQDALDPAHGVTHMHTSRIPDHKNLAAARLDVLGHRLAEAIRLVPIEEGRLAAVGLVDEAVHRREHHRHAQLVRVDKVERCSRARTYACSQCYVGVARFQPCPMAFLVFNTLSTLDGFPSPMVFPVFNTVVSCPMVFLKRGCIVFRGKRGRWG